MNNMFVSGTAAEIAGDRFFDFIFRGVRIFPEECQSAQDHPLFRERSPQKHPLQIQRCLSNPPASGLVERVGDGGRY